MKPITMTLTSVISSLITTIVVTNKEPLLVRHIKFTLEEILNNEKFWQGMEAIENNKIVLGKNVGTMISSYMEQDNNDPKV